MNTVHRESRLQALLAEGLSWGIVQGVRRTLETQATRLDRVGVRRELRRAGARGASGIFTHMGDDELRALYHLAANCPPGASVLEIGSYLGASTCYLAAGLWRVGGRLCCVDTWQNETMGEGLRDTFAEFRRNTSSLRSPIATIRKRSKDLRAEDLQLPLHLAFIDADHSYAAVKHDLEKVEPWMAEDGVIALHDFSHPMFEGVTRAVGEALASGRWLVGGFVDSLVWLRPARWIEGAVAAPAPGSHDQASPTLV